MKNEERRSGSSRLRLCWLVLVTGLFTLVPVRRRIDRVLVAGSETDDVPYRASGESLRHLNLGYEGLLADVYWTRAVQYYGRQRLAKSSNFEALGPLLRITTALDPQLIVAYRFGAVFLAEKPPAGAGQPLEALRLLRQGIVANPDYWRLWQDLGFIYYWDLQDYAGAARAFQAGSERPGAQVWLRSLAATVAAKGGELQTARLLWLEIYRHADNDQIRRSAQDHLMALTAQEDLGRLNRLLTRYSQDSGRPAQGFGDLVAAGLLSRAPVDPSGAPYVINPEGQASVSPGSRVEVQLIR